MLTLQALPARQGDALWVRWGDDGAHQLLVDMGTGEVGTALRARLERLAPTARRFELLVGTHVDSDHIGGMLTCLAEAGPMEGLELGEVWFNGWEHLHGRSVALGPRSGGLGPRGPVEGERFSSWLAGQRWNTAFGGGPVWRRPGEPPRRVELAGGLVLTVLGPTPHRLRELQDTWADEVNEAIRKGRLEGPPRESERAGPVPPPRLESEEDLAALAEDAWEPDDSAANGSSIVLLLEYGGVRLLLAGDAYGEDVVEGLRTLGGGWPVGLDAFKLPHHGSKRNVSEALVQAVRCPLWLFSTDGTQHRHPDAPAVARVLRGEHGTRPVLAFNVSSRCNSWWSNAGWRRRFRYSARFGDVQDGLALVFPEAT